MVENLEGEIWKPVVGYEGLYEVSNFARVKSLKSGRYNNIVALRKPVVQKNGYVSLYLSKNKEKKCFYLHRLVYDAFYGNLPKWDSHAKGKDRLEINHKDENPLNNRLENLELVTCYQNNNYGSHNKKIGLSRERKVYQYTLEKVLVRTWRTPKECAEHGFNQGAIAACCKSVFGHKKNKNKYKGFIWSYTPLDKVEESV